MTPIAEKALIMRISNSANKLGDLIDTVVKTEDATPSVLDTLDQRILDEVADSYVAWALVIPYLRKFVRHELFNSMNKKHPATGYELAELFKVGYGGDDVEKKLCNSLYGIFRDNANPLRGYILDALKERGNIKSLEMLEVIKYEINPEVKTKHMVAKSILDEGSVEEKSTGFDKTLYMLEFQSLDEFSQRVNSAIDLMLSRGVKIAGIQVQPDESVPFSDVVIEPSANISTPIAKHKRSASVEGCLSEARNLMSDYPRASLNTMRQAAEAICKDIIDETCVDRSPKQAEAFNSLEDMLHELRRRRRIPLHIDKHFGALQQFGNLGSHHQELAPEVFTSEMAETVLLHLKAVVDWYKFFSASANKTQTNQ